MQSPINGIFDEAEHRYLKPEELQAIGHYVGSITDRLNAYRALRDRELDLIQQAADQLQFDLPEAELSVLERAIKNGMLILRHCGMAMLLNDPNFLQSRRLLDWLKDSIELYQSQGADAAFFELIKQQLKLSLTAQQMALLEPFLNQVEAIMPAQPEEMLTVAGIF